MSGNIQSGTYRDLPTALDLAQRIVNRYGDRVHVFLRNERGYTRGPYCGDSSASNLRLLLVPQDDGASENLRQYLPKIQRRASYMPMIVVAPPASIPLVRHESPMPHVNFLEPKMVYFSPEFIEAKSELKESIPLHLGKSKLTGVSRALLFNTELRKEAEGKIERKVAIKDQSKVSELEVIAKQFGKEFPYLNTTLKRIRELRHPDADKKTLRLFDLLL